MTSKCFTLGFRREDGSFQVLATFNNNDEIFTDEDFESLMESTLVQMYIRLKRRGDEETILEKLEREDCPDYVDLEE